MPRNIVFSLVAAGWWMVEGALIGRTIKTGSRSTDHPRELNRCSQLATVEQLNFKIPKKRLGFTGSQGCNFESFGYLCGPSRMRTRFNDLKGVNFFFCMDGGIEHEISGARGYRSDGIWQVQCLAQDTIQPGALGTRLTDIISSPRFLNGHVGLILPTDRSSVSNHRH
jgi:hypothetical protein